MPRDQLARLAFEAIDRMLRNKRRAGVEYLLETHLVERQSSCAVRARLTAPGKLEGSYQQARQ
jgi:hypothetical protein